MIRHGETDWNAEGRLQGTLDTPLNDQGIRQAAEAAERLRDQSIACIYASPMLRARRTAEIIAEALGVPIVYREALRERDFGVLQGLRAEEASELFGEAMTDFRTQPDAAPDGGETNRQVMLRLQPVISEISSLPHRVLTVTHGAVARVIYKMLTHADDASVSAFRLENCGVLVFGDLGNGRYSCGVLETAATDIG